MTTPFPKGGDNVRAISTTPRGDIIFIDVKNSCKKLGIPHTIYDKSGNPLIPYDGRMIYFESTPEIYYLGNGTEWVIMDIMGNYGYNG
jgi:hypothetical protein